MPRALISISGRSRECNYFAGTNMIHRHHADAEDVMVLPFSNPLHFPESGP